MTEVMIDAKEKNRLKQAKFYELNKERINEKRRLKRQQKKEIVKPVEEQSVVEPLDIVIKKSTKKSNVINLEDLINGLKNLKDLGIIKTTGTLGLYIANARQVSKLIECDDFNKCFKDTKLVIDKIDNSEYSINQIKSLYQFIVFIMDKLKLKYTPKIFGIYKDKFDAYKLKSKKYTEEKTTEEIIPFTEYLKKVKEHFGEDSKMYNLMSLYSIGNTFRDNFVLEIVSLVKDTEKDKTKNYFVKNIKGHCFLIINDYKTATYGQQKIKLSKKLSNQIEKYIEKNGLVIGNYLFGEKKLGDFIRKSNLEIGIHGGIDLIRKMKFSEENVKGLTEEEQVALAKKFQHSTNAQVNYQRMIKE